MCVTHPTRKETSVLSLPRTMTAVTIDRFGGPEVLRTGPRPLPEVGPSDVLIKVAHAAVGSWDPIQREGLFVRISGVTPTFPLALGGEGSGRVVALGRDVDDRLRVGDEVYALGEGFYAEYVAVDVRAASLLPSGLALEEAGAMPVVAMTALHGLVDELRLQPGESLLIAGASGDVGLVAVQLAKRLGGHVFAVASGSDGTDAVLELGADGAVDGRTVDIWEEGRRFAPGGFDAVLVLSGGPSVETASRAAREGGRLAYPHGIDPEPTQREGLTLLPYDLTTTAAATAEEMMKKLNTLIGAGPFTVPIAHSYSLARIAEAQQALDQHRVGKLILTMAQS